jgi:hypothetical protein
MMMQVVLGNESHFAICAVPGQLGRKQPTQPNPCASSSRLTGGVTDYCAARCRKLNEKIGQRHRE